MKNKTLKVIGSTAALLLLSAQAALPLTQVRADDSFVPNTNRQHQQNKAPKCNVPDISNSDQIDDTTITGSGLDDPKIKARAKEIADILNKEFGLGGATIAGVLASPLNHENQTLDPMVIEGGGRFETPLSKTGSGSVVGSGYSTPGSSIWQYTPYTKYTQWKDFEKYGGHTVKGNTMFLTEDMKSMGAFIKLHNWNKYGISNAEVSIDTFEQFLALDDIKDVRQASIVFMTAYERGSYSLGANYFNQTSSDGILAYKKLGLDKYKSDPEKIAKYLGGSPSDGGSDNSPKPADDEDPCQENDDSAPTAAEGALELKDAIGKVVGNGQCYGLTSYYVNKLTNGKFSLGAGIDGTQITGPNTSAAAAIGDLNWSQYLPKWKVIKNPKYSDLRPGDIINWNAGAKVSADFSSTTDPVYGHTAVLAKVDGNNKYTAYSQNPGPVAEVHWTYGEGIFASLVRPVK